MLSSAEGHEIFIEKVLECIKSGRPIDWASQEADSLAMDICRALNWKWSSIVGIMLRSHHGRIASKILERIASDRKYRFISFFLS